MIKEERYQLILDYLQDKEIISINELSDELDIPFTTLRRDLNLLHGAGKVYKMHGAVKKYSDPNLPEEYYIDQKININIDYKKEVAVKAAQLVEQNETIFIDGGSTAFYFCHALDPRSKLKIITSSAMNLRVLAELGHKDITILGGSYDHLTGTIIGKEAIKQILEYDIDKCFIGIDGVSEENIYLLSNKFINIKKALFMSSKIVYGLVDKSKFGNKTPFIFPDSNKIKIITNKE